MWSLSHLPAYWAHLYEQYLRNYFSHSRGHSLLAQIWFGRPTQSTAIWMGDSAPFFEQIPLPVEIDPAALAESQSWFATLNIMTIECEGFLHNQAVESDIASILSHVIRPIVRKIALECFAQKWSRDEESTIGFFPSNDCNKSPRVKICDWAEAFVFGGIMVQHSYGVSNKK